ncbi:hypothetical protein DFH94DRAFT_260970 [Russula ochroleuca]|uniref:Transmembrane protein n=1 Tax=Russula ochroleuca TaxID=152965 RepID=A0A9P5N318_9AGAM|nr:hypothetical protein DFH94DRAFT_260970 [Russula ochroleuca]
MKRKTIISAVAVEAPCIYVVSFMWVATGAYAEHLNAGVPGYPQFLTTHECIRHKVLEGFAFVNWIQLMLYANTLMTVATICHVRRRSVWLLPVTELPTLGAPALTFDSGSDMALDSPFMGKTDESQVPILGVSRPNANARGPSHFRSRLTFPQHPTHRRRTLSALSSPLPASESVESLVPSVLTQTDVTSQNQLSHLSTWHRIVPRGEPPTYSGPGAGYEPEAV